MTTQKALSVLAVVALTGGAFFIMHHEPVCPDDFGTDDAGSAQYLAATDKWTNDFFDSHPDATMTDWAEARHQFYIDHHCVESLKRYEEAKAGKGDPKTMQMVNDVLRDATQP